VKRVYDRVMNLLSEFRNTVEKLSVSFVFLKIFFPSFLVREDPILFRFPNQFLGVLLMWSEFIFLSSDRNLLPTN
jgi:hypothetical protein